MVWLNSALYEMIVESFRSMVYICGRRHLPPLILHSTLYIKASTAKRWKEISCNRYESNWVVHTSNWYQSITCITLQLISTGCFHHCNLDTTSPCSFKYWNDAVWEDIYVKIRARCRLPCLHSWSFATWN